MLVTLTLASRRYVFDDRGRSTLLLDRGRHVLFLLAHNDDAGDPSVHRWRHVLGDGFCGSISASDLELGLR